MENIQVFEVIWRFSIIVIFLIVVLYVLSYICVNILNKEAFPKWSIFTNEIHIILRSLIIVFISFIFVKYMYLIEIGASDYFKINPLHQYSDYFQYIMNLGIIQADE